MSDLLSVRDLVVDYRAGRRRVRALDAVSLDIPAGQTLGLVGESGSGKTTLGRAILGLTPVTAGTITFDGADITRLPAARRRDLGRQIQAVFQDPYGSLNPALRVSAILGESLRAAGPLPRAEAQTRLRDMLARTGMPESAMARYPGAFSGGQRQRLAIARALMPGPRLVICDEATSALDLSVQAQIPTCYVIFSASCRSVTCSSVTTWTSCGSSRTASPSSTTVSCSKRAPPRRCPGSPGIPTPRASWQLADRG
jgi:ABC-type glutathione transport system ATPase component